MHPFDLEAVNSLVSAATVQKDEFETTTAFAARQTAAATRLPPTIVVRSIANHKYLQDDADAGRLNVSAYFFRNLNTNYVSVFGGHGVSTDGRVIYGTTYDNIDIVIAETERTTGRYNGSNAYGASVEVIKIQRDTYAIWDRKARSQEPLFPDQHSSIEAQLGSISTTSEVAKSLKSMARAAVVFAPKPPFFAYGNRKWEPRFDRPTEVNNDIFVIVADIQCALLLDHKDRVWAAWATH